MGAAEHLKPYRKPWKPGQSGNPGGRPKLPDDLRAIKALSQEEVARLIAKYARMGHAQMEAILDIGGAPVVELAIAKIFDESVKKGDWQRFSFLLDRAIGKVQVVEITDAQTDAVREIQDLSDQELLSLVREKMPALEKT